MKWKQQESLHIKVSAGGGYETDVTVRTRYGWECSGLLYGMRLVSSKAERGCLKEPCKAKNSLWEWRMVPERMRDKKFAKYTDIHSESNVSTNNKKYKNI